MPLSTLSGGGNWNPSRLPGLVAWWNANRNAVVLDGGGDVAFWNDSAGGNAMDGSGTAAEWLPNGWGTRIGALGMQVAVTGFSSAAAGLVNPGSGTDIPFSLFCTIQPTAVAAHVIACWQHSVGSSLSSLEMLDGVDAGKLRYRRTDAVGSSVNLDGASNIGFAKRRIGLLFAGTTARIFADKIQEATGASDVGNLTPDTFKLGTGPGVDSFTGLFADFVLMNRLVSVADYLAYEEWSRATLGT